MYRKRFIRFVVTDNGNGKIRAMNMITKIYDDEWKFIEILSPYIYATGNQINVDMEETDTNKFLPLRHQKHKDGKIVKKTQSEINQTEQTYQQAKQQKLQEIAEKNEAIENAKEILTDENKSLQKRVDAMSDLIKLEGI